jgi:methionine-rich copper-binding protein CopC
MGQAFTAPTLSNPNNLAVTYSSSKETVATISEEGVVTIVGEGETTIKATFAGNDKYEPAEASYKLTVSSKATMEVSATGYEGVYDGNAHGITVTAPEGATVKYGTEEGKYDLTENPTYTDAGTYTVYYQVTKEDTETVTGSAKVTITKGSATLKFSAEKATATMGTTFVAPTLTVTPEGLQGVKYSSSNTNVATVNETTGAVTLVGAGEAVIKASFAGTTVYEAAEASYKLTVSEATPQTETVTLTFSEKTVSATLGEEFEAPTLTIEPEGLQGVKYSSSDANVATVNETTGAVTLVAAGETTIKASFAGNDNYEAAEASYTLTVNRAQSEGYGLWINDIQVREDNYFDVLGNKTDSKSGTIVFNPETNTLVMTNDVSNVEIESRLETLTLHINDVNKVKSIRFNNLSDATKTGKLAITTNGNFPGQIIITNDANKSAISGFSEITMNMGLQYLEPELVEIEDGELYKYAWNKTVTDNPVKDPKTKAVCDAVTIGVVITPLTRNVTVSMANASDYTAKDENGNTVLDENGNPKTVSMMNFAQNKDILLTLWTKNDEDNYQKGNDGDWPDAGFDNSDGDPGITMVITMTDAQALAVAASVLTNTIQPGGTTYSMEFKGATFIVPAGSGEIDVWVKTDPGYIYTLLPVGLSGETHKLDFNSPSIKEYQDLGNGKIKVTVEYNDLPTQTYYMLYLTEEVASGARGGTRLGKREKAHGKLYSVGVRPRSITEVNPPSEASGGVIDEEEDPDGVIDIPTPPSPPTGIQTVASESSANSGKWFTADGRQLEGKPTKPGFYIRNGKKIVIK